MHQTTIKNTVRCTGIGLHGGKQVELVLRPAPEDTGILFALRSGSGTSFLSPKPRLVVDTGLATSLGNGHDHVATVEHLLAAVRGLGIDNIRIEVQGRELPIMDGSAASFVYLLNQAGLRRQSKPRKVLAITKPVTFERDGKFVKATPHNGFLVDYTIQFAHPLIGRQNVSLEVTPDAFASEISKARTFGFLREVEYLHANGLALGGTLDNAVVLDEFGVLNTDGLRYPDEFVRHKLLDFVGDMAIMGLPLQGRFEVFASGHALNNSFLRHLEDNASEYLEQRVLPLPVESPAAAPAQPVRGLRGQPALA
ncbi:UDP-3-O-[3-hydroxymyristoyl] N-acetylglucosamine deacetylase [Humidesulfovibrio mexicanus]|jgi:UDP-3-O-[3-hydroxymyristoyl] N-acetylglucosamine deacetylase|uniref:UDP-3-O-acyl-N-acetylglucosamine deacetylase n=1 Tax=Humidesulfovibrio mexicanus TaxID=147047 RepID=A0A238XSX5_9BACT|nr:UDP-3-O-acyl-N-acetylglucosamine deacetylase [Humidesulfovibrio mexicanus]SNR61812.1 UDP-3-O-[3-hydroxymyristoyl] N-acetylglucosamine deacetylase [Humidesulfovibrio mexicanus]